MLELDQIDIVEVDIFDQRFMADPPAAWSRAAEKSWLAKTAFGYAVLDYDSMRDIESDPRLRTPNRDIVKMMGGVPGTPFERFTAHFMLALNGAEHQRVRQLVAPAFTPKAANINRPLMRETIERVLDDVADKGECDFAEVAERYPISVMCEMLGLRASDIPSIKSYLERMGVLFSLDSSMVPLANEMLGPLLDYATSVIEERRHPCEHPQDLVQSLCDLADSSDTFSDEDLKVLIVFLLGAGYDTTKNQLTYMMKLLCDLPKEYAKLAADPKRLKPFIEESLRFLNPIAGSWRFTNEEIEYRGVRIPADTMIMIPLGYAGRDGKKNADPNHFDPDRPNKTHLTFGSGPHICVGMFLARALMEEALPIIVRRLAHPRQTGPIAHGEVFTAIWQCRSLPIAFDPERRAAS